MLRILLLILLTLGIVIVAEKGRILHANHAAKGMLAARRPILAVNGALSVRDRAAERTLAQALRTARAVGGADL